MAVKRVLPPDFDLPSGGSQSVDAATFLGQSFDTGSNGSASFASTTDFARHRRKATLREQSKLRANLVTEMRCLSSLRHPNITTVMVRAQV